MEMIIKILIGVDIDIEILTSQVKKDATLQQPAAHSTLQQGKSAVTEVVYILDQSSWKDESLCLILSLFLC